MDQERDVLHKYPRLERASLFEGKFQCECGQAARWSTTKKRGANKGRRFLVCPKDESEQCGFFLWEEDEAAAKEWLKISQAPPMPEIPNIGTESDNADPKTPSGARNRHALPQLSDTPFTKAKRKASSIDIAHNEVKEDRNIWDLDASESSHQPLTTIGDPFTTPHQPLKYTRKVARTSTISKPGQHFADRLKGCTLSSPVSKSPGHKPSSAKLGLQLQGLDTSPTPVRFNDGTSLHLESGSDLTTKILDLIRADNHNLKGSTELQIRHELGLAFDVAETKLRRHERTILELRERVDELETMVHHLT